MNNQMYMVQSKDLGEEGQGRGGLLPEIRLLHVLINPIFSFIFSFFQDGFNASTTRENSITVLATLQAHVQLAQISIAVLTNLQTHAQLTQAGAEFHQLQHFQAAGKQLPSPGL